MTSNTIYDRKDVSSIFSIARFSVLDLMLHAWHIRARFELPHAWFLSPPAWSQDHKDGSLAAGDFVCYFFVKAGRRILLLFLQWVHFWLRIFSVILQQTLCPSLRGGCAVGVYLQCDDTVARAQILYVAGYPVHQNRLWANYFDHLTLAELRGTSILRRFEPHAVSDLVRAVLGT